MTLCDSLFFFLSVKHRKITALFVLTLDSSWDARRLVLGALERCGTRLQSTLLVNGWGGMAQGQLFKNLSNARDLGTIRWRRGNCTFSESQVSCRLFSRFSHLWKTMIVATTATRSRRPDTEEFSSGGIIAPNHTAGRICRQNRQIGKEPE
jgi:hypothetical protein